MAADLSDQVWSVDQRLRYRPKREELHTMLWYYR
jgi:hypothetical protein